ncbi:MAG: YidC/Oxa1 family insertase periplasmic-domain containing protein [Pirellulales bacterium]
MEQRRIIAFLLISFAVVMFFRTLFPPPPPPQRQLPPAAAQAGDANKQDDGGGDKTDEVPAQPQAPRQLPALAEVDAPKKFATLGSLDPESGYRMLATLSTDGASVHRVEMSSPRYADQHDRSGYLGELELAQVDGGMRVQVVGTDTPAALAGIAAGDLLVGAKLSAEHPIASAADLAAALSDSKPGQEVELEIKRGDDPPVWRTVTLRRRPYAVLRPEIENYAMRKEKPPAHFVDRPSFLLTLASLGNKKLDGEEIRRITDLVQQGQEVSPEELELFNFSKRLALMLERSNWQLAAQDATSVTFRQSLPELNLEFIKRYSLQPVPAESRDDPDYPGYHLQLDVELHNTGTERQQVAYRLDGPTGMPTEGWWYTVSGLRDVTVRFEKGSTTPIDAARIAAGKVATLERAPLLFAGLNGQYFSAVLLPIKESPADDWFETTDAIVVGLRPAEKTKDPYPNVSVRLARRPVELAAGESKRDSYQVFIGPKRPTLLAKYQASGDANYSLVDLIYYGWYGGVARPMVAILHFFYSLVGNYGIAIVMLTVVVRGALFPLSYKQTQSMARMQALKPEMDRIAEKYKGDMQKRSQATQELYSKHKINPLAGCLPMLLQLPIFIGLYRALMMDVELRGSPLLSEAVRWCSNLAAPDMLLDWSSVMPDFVTQGSSMFSLGPYFNLLPVVTVALFLITQKMAMPPPTNEQAAMQYKMMKYMTVFMGLFFYKVASGLCLYFIASSLWGIAERKLLKLTTSQAAAPTAAAESRPMRVAPKPIPNGSADQKKKRPKPRRK